MQSEGTKELTQCAAIKVHTKKKEKIILLLELMPNRGQLQPAHTPPHRACCRPRLCVPACHMSQAAPRQGTVVPRAAPESSMRGLMLVNNFRGTCINVQLGSTALPLSLTQHMCRRRFARPSSRVIPCNLLSNNL